MNVVGFGFSDAWSITKRYDIKKQNKTNLKIILRDTIFSRKLY